MCCYVEIMHVRLGVIKHVFPLSWGRGCRNRTDPKFHAFVYLHEYVC